MSETNGHTTTLTPPAVVRIFSALVNRLGLSNHLGSLFDGRRNLHQIFGYRSRLEYRDFKARYERQDLAHRICKAYPEATWAQPPTLEEADEGATEQATPFEAGWEAMAQRLQVYALLERTDLLANLGQYAVLLIGLRGQSDLRSPARPVSRPEDVLYLEPYSEEWAEIQRLDSDPGSPTFGQPTEYRINFSRSSGARARQVLAIGSGVVHASRVIHVAEDLLDDAVYGLPRLEPVFDRLDDLLKVVGGAAEMFYRDAKRRIALELRDDYHLEAADEAALTAEVEEFTHDFKDFLRVQGVDVKSLAGTVASPKEHYEVLLSLLAATTGIPRRILEGSERGALASQQDEQAWLQRVARRQRQFAEQRLLRPLVDWLIRMRAVPQPAQPYLCEWEGLYSLSETQQAEVTERNARAIAAFSGPGMAETVVPIEEFRERYLGLPPVSAYQMMRPPEAEEPL